MALMILKIGNTDDIVLLAGEAPDDPHIKLTPEEKRIRDIIHKLPGGKADVPVTPLDYIYDERKHVWITATREGYEEFGPAVRAKEIAYGASLLFPYRKNMFGLARTLVGKITEADFKNLQPASGHFIRMNLNDIHDDPLANPVPITPMNNRLIAIHKTNGTTQDLFTDNFPSVRSFGRAYLKQRRFQTA